MISPLAESDKTFLFISLEVDIQQDTTKKQSRKPQDSLKVGAKAKDSSRASRNDSVKQLEINSSKQDSTAEIESENRLAKSVEAEDSVYSSSINPNNVQSIPKAIIEPPVEILQIVEQDSFPNFFCTTYSKELLPKQKMEDVTAWILPMLLVCFFFLTILRSFYAKEISTIAQSVFTKGGFIKLNELDSTVVWRCLLLFLLLFLIVSPVFMYQTASYFNWDTAFLPYLSPYFQLLFIGAGLLGFKILIIGLIGSIFYVQDEAANYVTGIVVMSAFLAAIFIPISLAIKLSPLMYTGYILAGGLIILGLCYLYSVVNALITGLRSANLSLFHLFLYFCTLEILPVFIIIKTVKTLI